MADLASQKIRIRMKAYDFRLLDQSASEIVDTALRTGARLAGPIPQPAGGTGSTTIFTLRACTATTTIASRATHSLTRMAIIP